MSCVVIYQGCGVLIDPSVSVSVIATPVTLCDLTQQLLDCSASDASLIAIIVDYYSCLIALYTGVSVIATSFRTLLRERVAEPHLYSKRVGRHDYASD